MRKTCVRLSDRKSDVPDTAISSSQTWIPLSRRIHYKRAKNMPVDGYGLRRPACAINRSAKRLLNQEKCRKADKNMTLTNGQLDLSRSCGVKLENLAICEPAVYACGPLPLSYTWRSRQLRLDRSGARTSGLR